VTFAKPANTYCVVLLLHSENVPIEKRRGALYNVLLQDINKDEISFFT